MYKSEYMDLYESDEGEEANNKYVCLEEAKRAIRARSTHERVLRHTPMREYRRELCQTHNLLYKAGIHDIELDSESNMLWGRERDFRIVMVELRHYFHDCDCLDNIRRIRREDRRLANDISIHCDLLNGRQVVISKREIATKWGIPGWLEITGCNKFQPMVLRRSIPIRMRIANEGWYSTSRVVMTRDCRTEYVGWTEYVEWTGNYW